MFPNSTSQEALKRANELREMVAGHVFSLGGSVVKLTASFGVASYLHHGNTREGWVSAADAALCKAKNDGRNRVEAFTESLQIQETVPASLP